MRSVIKHWLTTHRDFSAYVSYYRGHERSVAVSLLLSVLQTVALFPIPLVVKHLFDHALPDKNVGYLLLLATGVVGLLILSSLITLLNRHITLSTSKAVLYAIRRELAFRSLFFGKHFYATEDLDGVHSRTVLDTERIDRMTNALLSSVLPGALVAVSLSCLLAYINPFLFLVTFAIFPPLYLVGKLLGKRVQTSIQEFHRDFASYSKGASFILTFNELISLSTAEAHELELQEKRIANLQHSSKRMAFISASYGVVQGNVLMLGGVVILVIGGLQIMSGVTTVGAIVSFYVTLNLALSSAKQLTGSVPLLIEGSESLHGVLTLLRRPQPPTNTLPYAGLTKSIVFDSVTFAHHESFSLRNVTFDIRKGETVGVFGPSGSGKSTLMGLLLGLYTPDSGSIRIDAHDIHTIDKIAYRHAVGVLPQDPLLFPGSIQDNLTYGLPDVSPTEIERITKLCRVDDFVRTLPEGYQTDVGNRSVQISGGQKQRIAIARALLRSPDILILDEPDNNLDEALIGQILEEIKKLGITVVLISHTSALQRMVDRSFVIRDGTVHEEIHHKQ